MLWGSLSPEHLKISSGLLEWPVVWYSNTLFPILFPYSLVTITKLLQIQMSVTVKLRTRDGHWTCETNAHRFLGTRCKAKEFEFIINIYFLKWKMLIPVMMFVLYFIHPLSRRQGAYRQTQSLWQDNKMVNYLHSKTKALHKKIKPEILRHEIVTSYHQLPPNDL